MHVDHIIFYIFYIFSHLIQCLMKIPLDYLVRFDTQLNNTPCDTTIAGGDDVSKSTWFPVDLSVCAGCQHSNQHLHLHETKADDSSFRILPATITVKTSHNNQRGAASTMVFKIIDGFLRLHFNAHVLTFQVEICILRLAKTGKFEFI